MKLATRGLVPSRWGASRGVGRIRDPGRRVGVSAGVARGHHAARWFHARRHDPEAAPDWAWSSLRPRAGNWDQVRRWLLGQRKLGGLVEYAQQ